MSVLASNRKESKFEAVTYSIELRRMFTELILRDFGIKNPERLVRSKYMQSKEMSEYFSRYRYMMHTEKETIDKLCVLLTNNLRGANSIYPTSMREYEQRRDYQNFAIVNCEQLVKELQRVVDLFDVDINLYVRYINAIDREIGLIKKWRQRDNKIKSYLEG